MAIDTHPLSRALPRSPAVPPHHHRTALTTHRGITVAAPNRKPPYFHHPVGRERFEALPRRPYQHETTTHQGREVKHR